MTGRKKRYKLFISFIHPFTMTTSNPTPSQTRWLTLALSSTASRIGVITTYSPVRKPEMDALVSYLQVLGTAIKSKR